MKPGSVATTAYGPGPVPTEKQVVARVCYFYKAIGCSVFSTQQTRPSRQAIGLPDLYVVHPRAAWWHEVKRPGGKQTTGQRSFQLTVERAGVAYVLGGLEQARQQAERAGIIKGAETVDLSGFRWG